MSAEHVLKRLTEIRIRGTLEIAETLKGIHRIKPHPETGFTFEAELKRTDLFRDTQKTAATPTSEPLFLDEDGKTWPASKLVIKSLDC